MQNYISHPVPRVTHFDPDVLVGASEALLELRQFVERAASVRDDVLLQGEPGTGKELAARVIHHGSRSEAPFVTIESSAPPGVLDSRLFGPKAAHSTLFLKEVGELSSRMQAQLELALEERDRSAHVGGKALFSDVRLIVSSTHDLESAARAGTFFEPLFQRLSANMVSLAPLRARRTDIPLLLEHFVAELRPELGHQVEGFSPDSIEILARRNWVGNIRELYEYVRTTVILAKAKVIEPVDLWLPRGAEDSGGEPWNLGYRELRRRVLLRFEAEFVGRVLKAARGNVSMAARLAKIDRKHLWRLIQRTGIKLER
jgi:DNA-binding NtrC family response regulator